MRFKKLVAVVTALCFGVMTQTMALAAIGDSGFEGGISSGEVAGKPQMQYKEVCFLSGEPVVMEGTLLIKTTTKQDTINTTYTYNLKNDAKQASITRVMTLVTKYTKQDNGQVIEDTSILGKPSEIVKVDGKSYTLTSYDLTKSSLFDIKPAVNYYDGIFRSTKTYRQGTTEGSGVTVEASGKIYGHQEYWGAAEAQTVDYTITSTSKDANNPGWTGTATVNISSGMTKKLKYDESDITNNSIHGGYIQNQENEGLLQYIAKLPEFSSGKATDYIENYSDTLSLTSFPIIKKLLTPELSHIKGHWAERDVMTLYSIEAFINPSYMFNPEEYITRAEFVAAVVDATKDVPDVMPAIKTTTRPSTKPQQVVSPFTDVDVKSKYFPQLNKAYNRGFVNGRDGGSFGPDEYLTMADALVVFINAIGLENLAPANTPVTNFKDNDLIPSYARKHAFVAQKIGMINGDEKGYLNPNENITKGQAAAMINRLLRYMREDIKKDYREGIVGYN